jgi:hypothetical protein
MFIFLRDKIFPNFAKKILSNKIYTTSYKFRSLFIHPEEEKFTLDRISTTFDKIDANNLDHNTLIDFFVEIESHKNNLTNMSRNEQLSINFTKLVEKIYNTNYINESNAQNLLPHIIDSACAIKASDPYVWGFIQLFYTQHSKKLSNNNINI